MSTPNESECPFCAIDPDRIVVSDLEAFAVLDAYPVTDGHIVVIPRRHVPTVFQLPPDEQANIWVFVSRVRNLLATKLNVHNFNVGVNDGILAEQQFRMHTSTSFRDVMETFLIQEVELDG